MDALPCCFGTIYNSQAPMAAVRLAMGAFPLFVSGPAGAKAHAPLNGGVCVCGGKERLAACLWQGGCLPAARGYFAEQSRGALCGRKRK